MPGATPVPHGPQLWKQFLSDSSNKEELFEYLSLEASKARYDDDKHLLVTSKDSVLHVGPGDIVINTCNHEVAEMRIVMHLMAAARACQTLLIQTGDTDILVIIPRHEVEGGYRFRCRPSVRHSVRLSRNRFRSITQTIEYL